MWMKQMKEAIRVLLVDGNEATEEGLSQMLAVTKSYPLCVTYTCGPLDYSSHSYSLAKTGYHSIKWLSGGVAM